MARKVFENSMVAHVWAQQSQSEGRSSNGNFYFRDSTIYSYGGHFPIARFYTAPNGARYVLFTTRGYSVSTSKHIGYTRSACSQFTRFYVRDPSSSNVRGQYQEAINAALDKAAAQAARHTRNWQNRALAAMVEAKEQAEAANSFAEYTGAEWRLDVPEVSPEAVANVAAQKAAREKAEAERIAKEQAEGRAAWLAGLPAPYGLRGFDAECGGAALRVMGDQLETSHGASVPLDHAIRAFRFLKLVRERGEGWHHNGHSLRVGHFTVDAIEPDGSFRAGCHTIKWPEVERIARALGVFDTAPSDAALTPSRAVA